MLRPGADRAAILRAWVEIKEHRAAIRAIRARLKSFYGSNYTTRAEQRFHVLQEIAFAPVTARFFRFTALQEINTNGWTSAAEISVLPAGGSSD